MSDDLLQTIVINGSIVLLIYLICAPLHRP